MATHFDYLCIGGGSGGIASANRAAMYGAKVALIEAKISAALVSTLAAYRKGDVARRANRRSDAPLCRRLRL